MAPIRAALGRWQSRRSQRFVSFAVSAASFRGAIAELDKGLETQPDYMWAFLERACSYAQLGRIREAASDQKRGLDELRATWNELTPGHAGRHNLDNAARIERELQGRLAANDLQPTSAPCNGYWDYAEGRRERSPLLAGRELAFPQKVR